MKWVKRVDCMITDGNQMCGGDHSAMYTDAVHLKQITKTGGTWTLIMKTGVWGRTEVTTGVRENASSGGGLSGLELSSSTSDELCGFEHVP